MGYESYAEAWAKHQALVQVAEDAQARLSAAILDRDATPPESPDRPPLDQLVMQRQYELVEARTAISSQELEQARIDPDRAAFLEQGLAPTEKQIWEAHDALVAEAVAAEQRVHEEVAKLEAVKQDAELKLEADRQVEAAREALAEARTAVAEFQWAQTPEIRDALEAHMPAPLTPIEQAINTIDGASMAIVDKLALDNVIEESLKTIHHGQELGDGALQGVPVAEAIKATIEAAPHIAAYTEAQVVTTLAEAKAFLSTPEELPPTHLRTPPPVLETPNGPAGPSDPTRQDPPVTVQEENKRALEAIEEKHKAQQEALEKQLQKAQEAQESRIDRGDVKDPDKARELLEKAAEAERAKLEERQAQERARELELQRAEQAREAAERAMAAAERARQQQLANDHFR